MGEGIGWMLVVSLNTVFETANWLSRNDKTFRCLSCPSSTGSEVRRLPSRFKSFKFVRFDSSAGTSANWLDDKSIFSSFVSSMLGEGAAYIDFGTCIRLLLAILMDFNDGGKAGGSTDVGECCFCCCWQDAFLLVADACAAIPAATVNC